MSSHLFGAISSTGCPNVALRKTADDYEKDYGTEAANFIRGNFYIDDGLRSVPTPSDVITLIESTREERILFTQDYLEQSGRDRCNSTKGACERYPGLSPKS